MTFTTVTPLAPTTISMDQVTNAIDKYGLTNGSDVIVGSKTFSNATVFNGVSTFNAGVTGLTSDMITQGTTNLYLTGGTQTIAGAKEFTAAASYDVGLTIGNTNTNSQSISFVSSGTSNTSQIKNTTGNLTISGASAFTTAIGSSTQKLTVGNSLGAVVTGGSLTVPNGLGAATGGITILGSSANSSISTNAASNNLVVNVPSSSSFALAQNGTGLWTLSTTGTTISQPQNLTFTPAQDKLITFTNSGGNSTIACSNATGATTYNVPATSSHTFQINGGTALLLDQYKTATFGNAISVPNVAALNMGFAQIFKTIDSTFGTSYQMLNTDNSFILVNTSGMSSAFTLILPNGSQCLGRSFTVVLVDATKNLIISAAGTNGSINLNGSSTYRTISTVWSQYTYTCISSGGSWYVER